MELCVSRSYAFNDTGTHKTQARNFPIAFCRLSYAQLWQHTELTCCNLLAQGQ